MTHLCALGFDDSVLSMAATADPQQGTLSYLDARLRSWIDQSERNQNIISTEHEHHEIATTLYQTCVDLYRGIWDCYRRDGKKSGKFRDQIRDNLSQLLLLGDTVENGRLDACLGYSDDLKECVLDILSHIAETLIGDTHINARVTPSGRRKCPAPALSSESSPRMI